MNVSSRMIHQLNAADTGPPGSAQPPSRPDPHIKISSKGGR
jgi:hypothetical protein